MELLEFHRTLLSDHAGQSAFRRAIFETIRGGETVLDLGTGTGIHALFACQAGAKKVYAVDQHEVIELARQICRANGYADRVQFIHASAAQAEIPEPVDVIVTHQGTGRLLDLLPDARDRFLKRGGILIPTSIAWFCAPVEVPAAYEENIEFWGQQHYDLTFAPLRAPAVNSMYRWRIAPKELLGQPIELVSFDFTQVREPTLSAPVETEMARSGILHGVGIWFVQWLTQEIAISTAPPCDLPFDLWGSWLMPIATPTPVERGDTISISIQTGTGGWRDIWKWTVAINDRQGSAKARFTHSTFSSMLLPRDTLRKQALEYVPSLTPHGAAARFVLECCDGGKPLRQIEEETAIEFPALFKSNAEAAAFVADIIKQYSA